MLSADTVQVYKPAPQVYELAPRHLGLSREEIIFVSTNGFDVVEAKAFGFTVCWVNRSGVELDELGVNPDATAKTLSEIKKALAQISTFGGSHERR